MNFTVVIYDVLQALWWLQFDTRHVKSISLYSLVLVQSGLVIAHMSKYRPCFKEMTVLFGWNILQDYFIQMNQHENNH